MNDTGKNALAEYKKLADVQVEATVVRLEKEKKTRSYIPQSSYTLSYIREEVAALFANYGITDCKPESLKMLVPPAHIDADLTVSVFEFSKVAKKAPAQLATEIAAHITASAKKNYIVSAVGVNGYINFILNRPKIFGQVVHMANALGKEYGHIDTYKGKIMVIDYSAPNIAKPFGVGHLRSTVIGQALANIYEAVGYSVVRDNHLGDWGTQFGSLIYAYQHWGDEAVVAANPIKELNNLYIHFNEVSKEDENLKAEARKIFARLEQGDSELVALWKKFSDISLKEFQKTYDVLGVHFDVMLGESYFVTDFTKLLTELKDKGVAKVGDGGAVIVDGLGDLPIFLLQKADGSTLYILRDIVTLMFRRDTFHPDVILYVVGSEQKLNFRELFALCDAAGYSKDIKLAHVDFGLVLINGSKMSTRKGTLVNLDNVLEQIIAKAKEIVASKGDVAPEHIDATAKIIGTSALIYADLKQNRNSNIEFDWDKMLSLESGSSVYLQYTYVRIMSILTKSGVDIHTLDTVATKPENLIFEDVSEFRLAFKLAFFSDALLRAMENNTPNIISIYLEELTAEFNHFYSKVSILKTEKAELKQSRLALLSAVATVIQNALAVLNIPVITKM